MNGWIIQSKIFQVTEHSIGCGIKMPKTRYRQTFSWFRMQKYTVPETICSLMLILNYLILFLPTFSSPENCACFYVCCKMYPDQKYSYGNSGTALVKSGLGPHMFKCWLKLPSGEKSCLRGFANSKGADEHVHPHSLISPFVFYLSENII